MTRLPYVIVPEDDVLGLANWNRNCTTKRRRSDRS